MRRDEFLKALIATGVASCLPHRAFAAGLPIYPIDGEPVAPPPPVPLPDYSKFNYYILTPPAGPAPRINGPKVFGVRPGHPVFYGVPATGTRPMWFAAHGLPRGVSMDPQTGLITGVIDNAGTYAVMLSASSASGSATRPLRIVVGEKIGLTPAMGWSTWNAFARDINQDRILRCAKALVASGLKDQGFSYINLDDCWQGQRAGRFNALQGNRKFPDIGRLAREVHALGLKFGVYSTPWMVSYTGYPGGSADDPADRWIAGEGNIIAGPPTPERGRYIGEYDFFANDVRQWADWGVDYVKMDWHPNDVPHVKMMHDVLRKCGRDIMLSLSNTAPLEHARDYMKYAQSWRTTGDIWDAWTDPDTSGHATVSEIGFNQERWAAFAGPGHFPDADMLAVGWVSYWRKARYSRLSPDEQYSHISLWSMLGSPLILGMDLERLDPFTIGLFSNPEVIDVNQDSLGVQAVRMATLGAVDVYVKPLDDGSKAVGFFNRDDDAVKARFNKFRTLGLPDRLAVRDLWRQKDLGTTDGFIDLDIPGHGVLLTKMGVVK